MRRSSSTSQRGQEALELFGPASSQSKGRKRRGSVSFLNDGMSDVSDLGMTLVGDETNKGLFGQALSALDALVDNCHSMSSADDLIWSAEQEIGRLEWEEYFTRKFSPLELSPQRESREREALIESSNNKRDVAIEAKREAEMQRRESETKLRKLMTEFVKYGRARGNSSARYTRSVKIDHDQEGDVVFASLGVSLGPGLTVTRVNKNSAAKNSNLTLGSRIIAVNGRRVANEHDINKIIKSSDGKVVLTVSEFTRGDDIKSQTSEGSRCAFDGDSTERVVEGLYLTPPAIYSQGAGWYMLVEGHHVNSFPVWERTSGTGSFWYVYSTPDGEWAVASSQFAMSNNQAELVTAFAHGGVMPIYFDGEWLENDEGTWCPAKGMRVAELARPPVDDAMTITAVIAPHIPKEPLCGMKLSEKMIVETVEFASAAEEAGIQAGVQLLAIDGQAVDSVEEATGCMASHSSEFCVTMKAAAGDDSTVSQSLCPIKGGSDSYASIKSSLDLRMFGEKLMATWNNKEGTILDELATNLVFPPDSDPHKVLSEAAVKLLNKKAGSYPDKNCADLLVMRLYTMAGPDIDALVGFENVPVFSAENRDVWDKYVSEHTDRNSAIFSDINWASRTASDVHHTHNAAWATLKKWIKFLGLLLSLSSEPRDGYARDVFGTIDKEDKGTITKEQIRQYMLTHPAFRSRLGVCSSEYDEGDGDVMLGEFMHLLAKADPNAQGDLVARGITGLPEEVYQTHAAMGSHGELHWPSPASCAFDRQVSESYIRGEGSNANKKKGSSILFLVSGTTWGLPLQAISQYPKEAELLLPPLCTFSLTKTETKSSLGGALVMELKCKSVLGASSLLAFCNITKVDSLEASDEMKRIFSRESNVNKVPAGTPVEVKVGLKPNGAGHWKRGVVVKSTPLGYLVEWQDDLGEHGVKTQEVEDGGIRVLPMSIMLRDQLDRDGALTNKRFIKKEMVFGTDCLEGLTFRGRVVESVEPDTPAARMGFIEGSTIVEVQGVVVHDEAEIREILNGRDGAEASALVYIPRVAARAAVLERVTDYGMEERILEPDEPIASPTNSSCIEFVGNYVVRVEENSTASNAGLIAGCKIMSIDGKAVGSGISERDLLLRLELAQKTVILYPCGGGADEIKTLATVQKSFAERTAIMTKAPHESQFGLLLSGKAVSGSHPDSAADKAAIPQGSVVCAVDGESVDNEEHIATLLSSIRAGDACILEYLSPTEDVSELLASMSMMRRNSRIGSVTEVKKSRRRLSLRGSTAESLGFTIEGTTVVGVTPGSAADKAGLQQGSVLREIQGVKIVSQEQAGKALAKALMSNGDCHIVADVPDEEVPEEDPSGLRSELEEARLRMQQRDVEHRTELACLRAFLEGGTEDEMRDIRARGQRKVQRLYSDRGMQASTSTPSTELNSLLEETQRVTAERNKQCAQIDALHEEMEAFSKAMRKLKAENQGLKEERGSVSEEYKSIRDARKRALEDNEALRDSRKELKAEVRHLRDSRDTIKAKHAGCADLLEDLRERLRTAEAASPPDPALSGMWADIKAMHKRLDEITSQREEAERIPPQDMYEMRREMTCVRQRIRDVKPPSPKRRPPSKSPTRPVSPFSSRSPRRPRSTSPVAPPPVVADGSFGKFGLSLSESLFTENGVIAYTGVRVVDAAPPGAPFLRMHDVITHVAGRGVGSLLEFRRAVQAAPPHRYILFKVRRWEAGCIRALTIKVRTMATLRRPGSSGGLNRVIIDRSGESVTTQRELGKRARPRSAGRGKETVVQDPLVIFRGKSVSPPPSPTLSFRSASRSVSPLQGRKNANVYDEISTGSEGEGGGGGGGIDGPVRIRDFDQTIAATAASSSPKHSSPSPAVERNRGPTSHSSQTGHYSGRSYHGLSDEPVSSSA